MGLLLSFNIYEKRVALSCWFLLSTSKHLASSQWFCYPPLSDGGSTECPQSASLCLYADHTDIKLFHISKISAHTFIVCSPSRALGDNSKV